MRVFLLSEDDVGSSVHEVAQLDGWDQQAAVRADVVAIVIGPCRVRILKDATRQVGAGEMALEAFWSVLGRLQPVRCRFWRW